jgi:hypothetical protein
VIGTTASVTTARRSRAATLVGQSIEQYHSCAELGSVELLSMIDATAGRWQGLARPDAHQDDPDSGAQPRRPGGLSHRPRCGDRRSDSTGVHRVLSEPTDLVAPFVEFGFATILFSLPRLLVALLGGWLARRLGLTARFALVGAAVRNQ